ncbi:single-stranded-DNA-specific exonuclease RecJ [Sporomusa acidovorans]|uniref:Single-stranded-DNA-specific exonuclease RecJ n=1 Tax=Sporomusa acidovorans (strain ATCC 49682 / DSM 3132 / Mol) TaxID=1123286 RepID=A0ABZ3J4B8_SPOA4|nr:single-stranded-DNA-specific exonuclease RecJ [Sporomusa acidovorans]OZC20881.1 single-stranded-DNA-specific exonuclease RecJ [Sporomusa acidovorans DSM 3132]SDE59975.1 single-stranded-DNA-specific exonuclease [Sporomusa acidovorans]
MARLKKTWRLFPAKRELANELSRKLNISRYIAQVLINRGITSEQAAYEFLYADTKNMIDPYLLKGMKKAVARIAQAVERQEKITIYGDYDVDGITACAVLYKTMKRFGANIEFYIPDRQSEGYGLNSTALNSLIHAGTKLVITVDCGISAVKEIAAVLGQLDVIITDHHQPPAELPGALAIINPKQPGCLCPDKNLAGVGVAFKLCQGLWQHYHGAEGQFFDYLDIVAIGTVADIVPLTGENRALVKAGLKRLPMTENLGLKALLAICGLANKAIDSGNIGFVIAPRLNAVGRVSQATAGVELLITNDYQRAQELAQLLNEENLARQNIEKMILAKAEKQLEAIDLHTTKVLVLAGEEWHSGVIGIVASRLVDKYYKPVIMISLCDGIGKGSCRSIPAFDIYMALNHCSDLLTQFGGHRQAAGLVVPAENIQALRQRLNDLAASTLSATDYVPVLTIDSVICLEEIGAPFVEQMACLEPYGFGNPSPVFACRDVALGEKRCIGQQSRHLKLKLKNNGVKDVIAWNMGELSNNLTCDENIDLAFVPKFNEWQGQKNLQLVAQDIRQSLTSQTQAALNQIAPDRDCIVQVYLLLKQSNQSGQYNFFLKNIMDKISDNYHTVISVKVLETVLTILRELHLITTKENQERDEITIQLTPAPTKKLDLMDSPTFRNCLKMRAEYLAENI